MKNLFFLLLVNPVFFIQQVHAQAFGAEDAGITRDDHWHFVSKDGIIENDGGVSAIYAVPSYQCVGEISPSVELLNYGSNELTNALLKYSIDEEVPNYFVWEGSLLPGETDVIAFNTIEVPAGDHIFTVSIVEANGLADLNGGNNEGLINFYIVGNSEPVPMEEQFNMPALPDGYFIENTDAFGWKIYTQELPFGNLNHMLQMPFFNCNAGIVNMAYIQNLDLSAVSASALHFDVAYRYYQNSGLTNFDRLFVEVSEDCGGIWKVVYDKQKDELATLPPSGAADYFPVESSEWRTESIDLTDFSGFSNVMIRFNAFSGHGNNLYIDNLKISSTVGINSPLAVPAVLDIYPNPADVSVLLKVSSDHYGNFRFMIADQLGRIKFQTANTSNAISEVNLETWPSGLYHVLLYEGDIMLQQKSMMINR